MASRTQRRSTEVRLEAASTVKPAERRLRQGVSPEKKHGSFVVPSAVENRLLKRSTEGIPGEKPPAFSGVPSAVEHRILKRTTGPTATICVPEPSKEMPNFQQMRNELALPKVDDDGRGSPMSDDEAHSLSVNCENEPSEVIVSGSNVKSIRLKFPPRPPSGEVRNYSGSSTSSSSAGRGGRACPTEHADDTPYKAHTMPDLSTVKEHPDVANERRFASLPLPSLSEEPKELLKDYRESKLKGSGPHDSMLSLRDSDTSLTRRTIDHGLIDILEIGSDAVFKGKDDKFRNDILNAMEYFERQRCEMTTLNGRIMQELRKVIACNRDLEEKLWKLQECNTSLEGDNSGYRTQLEKLEKEKDILHDQSVNTWQEKVQLNEKICKLENDSKLKVDALQETISAKEMEIKDLKQLLNESKRSVDPSSEFKDRELQYIHDINALKEELKTRDNDRKSKADLIEEIALLRQQLAIQRQELENQAHRFLSLKKSFNELHMEKEKLKGISRSRRNSLDTGANNTWPSTGKGNTKRETPTSDAKPMDVAKRQMRQTLPTPGNGRNVVNTSPTSKATNKLINYTIPPPSKPSDKRSPDSLPPV